MHISGLNVDILISQSALNLLRAIFVNGNMMIRLISPIIWIFSGWTKRISLILVIFCAIESGFMRIHRHFNKFNNIELVVPLNLFRTLMSWKVWTWTKITIRMLVFLMHIWWVMLKLILLTILLILIFHFVFIFSKTYKSMK